MWSFGKFCVRAYCCSPVGQFSHSSLIPCLISTSTPPSKQKGMQVSEQDFKLQIIHLQSLTHDTLRDFSCCGLRWMPCRCTLISCLEYWHCVIILSFVVGKYFRPCAWSGVEEEGEYHEDLYQEAIQSLETAWLFSSQLSANFPTLHMKRC